MGERKEWILDEETTDVLKAAFIRAAEISEEATRIRRSGLVTAFKLAGVPVDLWEQVVIDFDDDAGVKIIYEQEATEPG